jgi:hypothetical protein
MPEKTGGGNTVDGENPNPASPQQETNTSDNPVSGDRYGQVKLATAIQAAKTVAVQGVSAAISNIGLATGNYYAQTRVQTGIQTIGTLANLGIAIGSGNWAMAAVAVASTAISSASELYAQKREREIANYEAAQYAKMLGYSTARR